MPSVFCRQVNLTCSLNEPVWRARQWPESQCCVCVHGIIHSTPIDAITSHDFNLFMSPTQFPASTSTLNGPACILNARERSDRATDCCHLEADVVRLIFQLLPNAGCTEVLHLGSTRTAQLQTRERKITLCSKTLGGHAKTAAPESKSIKPWMCVESCASIQMWTCSSGSRPDTLEPAVEQPVEDLNL